MKIYSIPEIDDFAIFIRDNVAQTLCNNYIDNLDNFLTTGQVKSLIISRSLGMDENGNYMVDDDIVESLYEEIASIIYQSGLSKLAAQDLIDCAWDDSTNTMVFWAKE